MEIKYLKNKLQYLEEITIWLFNQWGHHDAENTKEDWYKRIKKSLLNKELMPIRLVGLIDGKPVGTASIVKNDMNTHPELSPWMADVYVKEDKRGCGYGSILVKRILSEAKELNFNKIYLFTPDKRSFYERLNWKFYKKENYRDEMVDIMVYNISKEGE